MTRWRLALPALRRQFTAADATLDAGQPKLARLATLAQGAAK